MINTSGDAHMRPHFIISSLYYFFCEYRIISGLIPLAKHFNSFQSTPPLAQHNFL